MADFFRWKNCDHVDVQAFFFNPKVARAYWAEVVHPSLAALDRQIQDWKQSKDVTAVVAVDDIEQILKAAVEAYCLAIQSLFERQLRGYLIGCAWMLNPELVPKLLRSQWDGLNELFQELRGLALADFQQYDTLDTLQLLGNVCRHGEGRSLEALRKKHPELWPGLVGQIPGLDSKPPEFVAAGFNLVLVRARLETFAAKVAEF